jgi:L-fucose mutarotase
VLRYRLLQPDILRGLAAAGHGSRVLIADGNYPVATHTPAAVQRVYLNLAPGLLRATDVLSVLADAIAVEAAVVMLPEDGNEPPIFAEFHALLPGIALQTAYREQFYALAQGPDVTLAIATGERRTFANILLTIGVAMPE